jgi:hypothetical protein
MSDENEGGRDREYPACEPAGESGRRTRELLAGRLALRRAVQVFVASAAKR